MASTTIALTEIDEDLQKAAEEIFKQEGRTASDVYRTLLRLTVEAQHTPAALFHPSPETLEAMHELDSGGGQSFHSVEALMAHLNAHD